MLLITKELALAVVKMERASVPGLHGPDYCPYCECAKYAKYPDRTIFHKDNCIVVRAKLLLEQEWDIK